MKIVEGIPKNKNEPQKEELIKKSKSLIYEDESKNKSLVQKKNMNQKILAASKMKINPKIKTTLKWRWTKKWRQLQK